MSKLSFIDKLEVLADVVSSSAVLSITILLLIASLFYIFITTNKKNAESSKRTYLIGYLIVTILVIAIYGSSLSKMFDYMMNNFFIAIYFPNLAIYFAAIIATNIILLISIFNFKITKIIKYINTTIYCIIHYLLILIINIITTNKLDVFSQNSVYENKEALALIELSSIIFVVWILFLILYRIIRVYQNRKEVKITKKVSTTPVESKKKKLPDYAKEVNPPKIATSISKKKQEEIKNKQKEMENLKKEEERKQLEEFNNLFTLEDYKVMLEILKEKNKKEIIEEPIIIENVAQQNLQEAKQIEEYEQNKISELQNLYRSVR